MEHYYNIWSDIWHEGDKCLVRNDFLCLWSYGWYTRYGIHSCVIQDKMDKASLFCLCFLDEWGIMLVRVLDWANHLMEMSNPNQQPLGGLRGLSSLTKYRVHTISGRHCLGSEIVYYFSLLQNDFTGCCKV